MENERRRAREPSCVVELVFVQVAGVLAEVFLQEVGVVFLDDCVQTGELIVDVQTRVSLARRRDSKIAEEQHAEALAHVRRILRVVSQKDRVQTEERLAGRIVIERHLQTELVGPAAASAVRLDGDVPHHLIVPPEIRRVFRLVLPMLLQRLQVSGIDR